MKRMFVLMLFSSFMMANPIMLYVFQFNEFGFNENGDWWLELHSDFYYEFSPELYDSLIISSSTGSVKVDTIRSVDENGLVVITADSLRTPLTFQEGQDFILLSVYDDGYCMKDSIPYNNPQISSGGGASAARVKLNTTDVIYYNFLYEKDRDYYVIDYSPTPLDVNDTMGVCGTMTGTITNKLGQPITTGTFMDCRSFPFILDGSGRYSVRALSTINYSRGETAILQDIDLKTRQGIYIDTIWYKVDPDTVLEKDIHLITDVYNAVEPRTIPTQSQIDIKTYPNPFNSDVTFTVDIAGDQFLDHALIVIYNLQGQKIQSISLGSENRVSWDGRDALHQLQSSGIYIYRLEAAGKILGSGSVMLLK